MILLPNVFKHYKLETKKKVQNGPVDRSLGVRRIESLVKNSFDFLPAFGGIGVESSNAFYNFSSSKTILLDSARV